MRPTGAVRNAWLPGSPIAKMTKLARDAGRDLIIDGSTVIVLPEGKARRGSATLITKDNGMLGYPTFTQDGISVRCLYNPALAYGGTIQVVSQVPRATGSWRIPRLSHYLSAYKPRGTWENPIEGRFTPGEQKAQKAETAKDDTCEKQTQ